MQWQAKKIWVWLGIAVLFFYFIHLVQPILLPFVVGILLAYFLHPAADKLENLGTSRVVASLAIIVLFFAMFCLVLMLAMPVIARQVGEFVKDVPEYIDYGKSHILPYINQMLFKIRAITGPTKPAPVAAAPLFDVVPVILARIVSSSWALFNLLALLMITPLVAFYLLLDWHHIIAQIDRLLPLRSAATIRQQCRAIDRTLSAFIRGQLNVCIIVSIIYAIGLYAIGLKYSFLVAILSGLLIIIPYVGAIISGIIGLAIAYVQFGTIEKMAAVLIVFVVGHMIEGYLLTPRLVGRSVDLHPLWILFGMLAGGAIFGFVGVLLAVPVTAVIGVLVRFAVARYLESDLYHA